MQALYPAEVLGYESRAKGLAFLGLVRLHLLLSFNVPLADLLYRSQAPLDVLIPSDCPLRLRRLPGRVRLHLLPFHLASLTL